LTGNTTWGLFHVTDSIKVTKVTAPVGVDAKAATLISGSLLIFNIITGKIAIELPLDFASVTVSPFLCVH
jgi:hypothetical protein